ncbi:MAG: Imm50 family immunity protein [Clostridia bacterium]|nr:Imm50 family immunity protein [Clostridia bacterium]MDD4686345.1 Imm50 family immunity protein [Clostridia bacterium]
MDFKKKLIDFWGYMPTFHDDNIYNLKFSENILTAVFYTRVSEVLHSKKIAEKYENVHTTIKFYNAIIENLNIDYPFIIWDLKIEKIKDGYKCEINGMITLNFKCSKIEIEEIRATEKNLKEIKLRYKCKIYYADGSSKFSGGVASSPDFEIFKNGLDGEIPWDLYDELINKKTSIKEVIKVVQPYFPKIITKIEIIDIIDNKVVNSIEI